MTNGSLSLILVSFSSGQIWGGLAFLLTGLAILWFGMRLRKNWKETLTWPKTTGRVVESRVESVDQGGETSNVARVVYAYEVEGVSYKSSSLGGTGMKTPGMIVSAYPVGRAVEVFFKPSNPAAAVLERRSGQHVAVLGLGVVQTLAGVIILAGIVQFQ